MNTEDREFLSSLLETPSPSGFEVKGQRIWVDYVSSFADDVTVDEYGNAIGVLEGEGPEIIFGGHSDEIGFIVTNITENGYLRIARIGGSDKTVSRGQHVQIHTDDGPVNGVIGQTAIHLRDKDENQYEDIREQHVDIGADDEEQARDLIEVGDPVTFATTMRELEGSRIAARGLDNRVGTWAAAEGLRRAAEMDVNATVYAVSTVQEELGAKGAQIIGFNLDPDVAIAVDVTHAVDDPESPSSTYGDVELGEGPVIGRGSANHPEVVRATRDAADRQNIDIQLQAAGSGTGTDADAFYTQRSGIPSLNIGVPNRYMHTPVEVIDTEDLDKVADLLAGFASEAEEYDVFSVDI
ncbi:MAG: M20/M25/M40 family metallo-hydrolase [Halobacteriaceae archaeon]